MSMGQFNALNTSIMGSALNMNKADYEISADEQNIQQKINPRHNIIQARSYLRVVEVAETPSHYQYHGDSSSVSNMAPSAFSGA